MKHTWLVGAVASVMLVGSAAAQTQPQSQAPSSQTQTQKPTPTQGQKPTPTEGQTPSDRQRQPGAQTQSTTQTDREAAGQGTMRRNQGAQPATAEVPTGETTLGTITIPRPVTADGKPLPRGRYTVRLTAQTAQPPVPGQISDLNRWVEFVSGGQVRGREVVSIVPANEVSMTMPGPDMPGHVGRNGSRVEMLKGGEYLRVWIARGGNHYLVHLPPQGGSGPAR